MHEKLKKILPLEINYKLKHLKDFIFQAKPSFSESITQGKRVFFLDTPAYGNIGDQAIALAMRQFVSDCLPDYCQYEVLEDELPKNIRWLKKNINEDDIICLTGGGNMGTTYQSYEAVRRFVIKNFQQNRIIIFPQTYDYENDKYGKKEALRARKVYKKAKKLVLTAREEKSFHEMKMNFQNKVLLVPDIVLYLDYFDFKLSKALNNNITGICLRNDLEKFITKEQEQIVYNLFPNNKKLTTTANNVNRITELNRKNFVEEKLQEFADCDLVITDRLHGMIFSYITNTPCIVFPNSNGKNEGVSKWITGNGKVLFCEKFSKMPELDKKNSNTYIDKFGVLKNEFFYS